MKILKPGKVEQRMFVCPDCGSIVAIGRYENAVCPLCLERFRWCDGEPYEEPTQDDRERLAQLLVETTQFCNFGEKAAYLIANGVTFREGGEYMKQLMKRADTRNGI